MLVRTALAYLGLGRGGVGVLWEPSHTGVGQAMLLHMRVDWCYLCMGWGGMGALWGPCPLRVMVPTGPPSPISVGGGRVGVLWGPSHRGLQSTMLLWRRCGSAGLDTELRCAKKAGRSDGGPVGTMTQASAGSTGSPRDGGPMETLKLLLLNLIFS